MTRKNEAESYTVVELAAALDAKESVLAPWIGRGGRHIDPAAISLQLCTTIGAVVTLAQKKPAKKQYLLDLFDQLQAEERQPEDWMVILRFRKAPTIEKPPIRIEVTGPTSAQPALFDPLPLVERLQSLRPTRAF